MTEPAATIVLPDLASPTREVWHVLFDLADLPALEWTLVGGQMVLLHALEHGAEPPQISQDGDVVGDVRTDRRALLSIVDALEQRGFTLEGIARDGTAHRYVKPATPEPVKIDVLAPEGLGAGADLTTTRPGRTIEVPGGTQALRRTERVHVVQEGRQALVPRPSLLAAIVGKGAACGIPGDPARHLRDLALLCAIAPDPFALAEEMTAKDRKRVRLGAALHDDAHPTWVLVPAHLRRHGQDAYAILTDDPG